MRVVVAPGKPAAVSPRSRAAWTLATASSVTKALQISELFSSHQTAVEVRSVTPVSLPPLDSSLVDVNVEVPVTQHRHHVGGLKRQVGVYSDEDGGVLVGAGFGSGPALVAVGRFFQSD